MNVCDVCNGTHVAVMVAGALTYYDPCPLCGPKSEEQLKAERELLDQKVIEAKRSLGWEVIV